MDGTPICGEPLEGTLKFAIVDQFCNVVPYAAAAKVNAMCSSLEFGLLLYCDRSWVCPRIRSSTLCRAKTQTFTCRLTFLRTISLRSRGGKASKLTRSASDRQQKSTFVH